MFELKSSHLLVQNENLRHIDTGLDPVDVSTDSGVNAWPAFGATLPGTVADKTSQICVVFLVFCVGLHQWAT